MSSQPALFHNLSVCYTTMAKQLVLFNLDPTTAKEHVGSLLSSSFAFSGQSLQPSSLLFQADGAKKVRKLRCNCHLSIREYCIVL